MIAGLLISAVLAVAVPSDIIPAPVSCRETAGFCRADAPVKTRIGKKMPPQAYTLTVGRRGITVEAADSAGAFYAMQTLRQMQMHSDMLACCVVEDAPRFGYRGFMLDLVSTWHDIDYIKRQIDAMALCKMNVLHLHLSDTHAWRLESKICPALHEKTSWRYGFSGEDWKVNRQFAPIGAPGAVGGYYTQEQMRELVAYAAARHIEIIPEIDLPGHAFALLSACPEYRCDSYAEQAAGGLPAYIVEICVGHPEIFDFIFGILDEVASIFPSRYLHVGGDEAKMTAWKTCTRCQALMAREGMKDVRELQDYFTRKVSEHLRSIGKIPVGWDEVAQDPGLDRDFAIMKWHTSCALPKDNPVIMATHNYTYLCYYQDAPVFEERDAWSRYLPLDVVYLWEPLAEPCMEGFPSDKILGLESCLWSSHSPTDEYMDYLTWPRLAALAERAWSPASVRDYDDFRGRVKGFYPMLEKLGTGYFDIEREHGHRPEKLSGARHLALGRPVTLNAPASPSFPADGPASLTDGRCGDWNGDDGAWLGFPDEADFTVDLGREEPVHYVGAAFLCHKGYSRDLPLKIEVSFSSDGALWSEPVSTLCEADVRGIRCLYPVLSVQGDWKARYIRYRAVRRPGAVEWPLLVDELIVL